MPAATSRRVLVAGATGYIGQHVVHELVARGHQVVCLSRLHAGVDATMTGQDVRDALAGAEVRHGDVTDPASITADGFRGERFDAVVSCLASRSGRPRRRVANSGPSSPSRRSWRLRRSPHSIVRPTAFFKSLSGQVARVKRGKPFVVFGDGELTACTPISEGDLVRYLADCLDDPAKQNAVLPVGGGSVSPDGLTMIMERDNNLFVATRNSPAVAWGAPTAISELNTGTSNRQAWQGHDGLTLYFDRALATTDLLMTSRPSISDPWSPPTVIAELSTADAGSDAWLSPDERYIMFSRNTASNAEIYEASR